MESALRAVARRLGLTERQRRFAHAYAADPDRHAARAAHRANASKPGSQSALSRNPKVIAYIQAVQAEAVEHAEAQERHSVMTVAELLATTSALARHDIADWLRFRDHVQAEGAALCSCGLSHFDAQAGKVVMPSLDRLAQDFVIDLRTACERGLGPQVSEVSFDSKGLPRVKFVDQVAVRTLLGRWLGLDRDVPPEEPEAQRLQREAYREALANPDVARALNRVSVEMEKVTERIRVRITQEAGK